MGSIRKWDIVELKNHSRDVARGSIVAVSSGGTLTFLFHQDVQPYQAGDRLHVHPWQVSFIRKGD